MIKKETDHLHIKDIDKSDNKLRTPENDKKKKKAPYNYVSLSLFDAFYEDYIDFKNHLRDILTRSR